MIIKFFIFSFKLSAQAVKDYNRGRVYLSDIATRAGVPVFDKIDEAVDCATNMCLQNSQFKNFNGTNSTVLNRSDFFSTVEPLFITDIISMTFDSSTSHFRSSDMKKKNTHTIFSYFCFTSLCAHGVFSYVLFYFLLN